MSNLRFISVFVLLIVLASGSLAPKTFGKAGYAPFEQKVSRSDLIAVVEVSSVASQTTNSSYRSVATLKIVEAIKGSKSGDSVLLEYDTGLLCPNVLYSAGERCLVFATRMTNGHYETYNDYYGKAVIQGDQSKGVAGDLSGKLEEVIARIKAILEAKEP